MAHFRHMTVPSETMRWETMEVLKKSPSAHGSSLHHDTTLWLKEILDRQETVQEWRHRMQALNIPRLKAERQLVQDAQLVWRRQTKGQDRWRSLNTIQGEILKLNQLLEPSTSSFSLTEDTKQGHQLCSQVSEIVHNIKKGEFPSMIDLMMADKALNRMRTVVRLMQEKATRAQEEAKVEQEAQQRRKQVELQEAQQCRKQAQQQRKQAQQQRKQAQQQRRQVQQQSKQAELQAELQEAQQQRKQAELQEAQHRRKQAELHEAELQEAQMKAAQLVEEEVQWICDRLSRLHLGNSPPAGFKPLWVEPEQVPVVLTDPPLTRLTCGSVCTSRSEPELAYSVRPLRPLTSRRQNIFPPADVPGDPADIELKDRLNPGLWRRSRASVKIQTWETHKKDNVLNPLCGADI